MNDYQRGVFENRKSISDNIETLIFYGKAFQKKSPVNQLSLFGTSDIEIKRPDISSARLSDYELLNQSDKEIESIGLPITYDEFGRYILIEKTLCDTSLNEASLCEEAGKEMTILAKVVKIEVKVSKNDNNYVRLIVERNGVSLTVFVFGKDWQSTLIGIVVNQIHIVRVIHNNNLFSIKKIQFCENIPIEKYIKSISLSLDKNNVSNVSAYIFKNLILRAKIPINYIIDGKVFESIAIGSINSKNCLELIDMGCEIKINKIL